jgi:hypothetical protein
MWLYLQIWFPLYTVALSAAVYFGAVSFIMSHGKPHPAGRQ